MAEWLSGDVIANGIRIHYYRTGGRKPPLVLSHGATDDGLCWTRLAKALESDYDVIMPDARGHGLSEAPESGYNADDRAADLAGFVDALRLDQPAIGGHSMGAGTSFYAVANYPGRFQRAILEDPPFRAPTAQPEPGPDKNRATRQRQQAIDRKAMTREELMKIYRDDHPSWAEEEIGPMADSKKRVSLAFVGAIREPERKTWQELLPTITRPLLLITGDPEKGGIVTPEVAEEASRSQPLLKVVRLRGAGHNVRREQFDGFIQAVHAFLLTTAR